MDSLAQAGVARLAWREARWARLRAQWNFKFRTMQIQLHGGCWLFSGLTKAKPHWGVKMHCWAGTPAFGFDE
eukprot:scaffold144665_cov145-Phaeocystis_antarctica.AAC.1